jgi:hypothetical protein
MKRIIATLSALAIIGTTTAAMADAETDRPVVAAKTLADRDEEGHKTSRDSQRLPLTSEIEQLAIDKRASQKAQAERIAQELATAERKKREAHARKVALAAAAKRARERAYKNRQSAKNTYTSPTTTHNYGSPQKFALNALGSTQFSCFNQIVIRESGWNYKATNATSGAYGLMQALPGRKMASAGADWRTNPITQVRWGISYMNGRYGSPCAAWSFWQSHHWY